MSREILQRMTRQRRVILDTLCGCTSHPTAEDLYQMVRHRMPHISLGTVYRNLDVLIRCGSVRKLELTGGPARFDGNITRHDHIRCIHCGRVDDLDPVTVDIRRHPALRRAGYQLASYALELDGICPGCSRTSTSMGPGDGGESFESDNKRKSYR